MFLSLSLSLSLMFIQSMSRISTRISFSEVYNSLVLSYIIQRTYTISLKKRNTSNTNTRTTGTTEFLPPEALGAEMGDILRYPKMMDVWSFGVVTWMILSPTPSIALNGFYPENSSREEMVNVRGVRAHRVGLWRSLEKAKSFDWYSQNTEAIDRCNTLFF